MYLFYGLKATPTAEVESRIFRFFQHLIRNRPQEFLEEKGMPTDNASIKARSVGFCCYKKEGPIIFDISAPSITLVKEGKKVVEIATARIASIGTSQSTEKREDKIKRLLEEDLKSFKQTNQVLYLNEWAHTEHKNSRIINTLLGRRSAGMHMSWHLLRPTSFINLHSSMRMKSSFIS
jgi:hypothetical protein